MKYYELDRRPDYVTPPARNPKRRVLRVMRTVDPDVRLTYREWVAYHLVRNKIRIR